MTKNPQHTTTNVLLFLILFFSSDCMAQYRTPGVQHLGYAIHRTGRISHIKKVTGHDGIAYNEMMRRANAAAMYRNEMARHATYRPKTKISGSSSNPSSRFSSDPYESQRQPRERREMEERERNEKELRIKQAREIFDDYREKRDAGKPINPAILKFITLVEKAGFSDVALIQFRKNVDSLD